MNPLLKYILILLGLVSVSGCAPVISKEVMRQIEPPVPFAAVFENPDTYQGSGALWGGVIVSSQNLKEGTLIEVMQKPLGFDKGPIEADTSGGRFLALYDGYLDTALYAKDREITVAGIVKGKRTRRLDEIQYQYPLLAIKEIYLWRKEPESQTVIWPSPYPYFYYGRHPYWLYYPYW